MSENDFYVLNGNTYRGSRYATFAGGGVDAQGNVSSAINQNSANNAAQSGNNPTITPTNVPSQTTGVGIPPPSAPESPQTIGGSVKNLAIGAAVPAAATTIGSAAGTSIATGLGFGKSLSLATSGLANKVSGGLLGTTSSATNSALASLGGKFGPATQASVGKAALGANAGGAVGSGVGTFAATLLSGGSFKDAAVSGIGAGVGFAIGNAILPGAGGFIGSTLGSLAGGLFGGKPKRQTISSSVDIDETGKAYSWNYGQKGGSLDNAKKFGDSIAQILNTFSTAAGLKLKKEIGNVETNFGKKDTGTKVSKAKISSKVGDVDTVTLNYFRNLDNYDLGDDSSINDFWKSSVTKAGSINELGGLVDNFLANRKNGPSPSLVAMRNEGKSKFNFAS